ncbi:MAG: hypothetical protein KKA67_07140 [Spirochaetes bacterium]|nr:hypothetical protein [Spirochaetota bacterium]MBU1078864.1 hypothetical protein [Spirochaetota bacterium]
MDALADEPQASGSSLRERVAGIRETFDRLGALTSRLDGLAGCLVESVAEVDDLAARFKLLGEDG